MRNVVAIAGKEIRSYFASPIAYIVIGLFAAIFGFFYVGILDYFLRNSLGMGEMGPQTANVNQDMIRFVLQNFAVVMLFLLPMVTMRSYAEEKRSGTIELLLTSPITDAQIITGKFLGAITLYAAMLLVTWIHIGLLFLYGKPEILPILAGYLGLFLLGASFIALGLFISSLTSNQIVAGVAAFATALILWIIDWLSDSSGPVAREVLSYLSITKHLDDFAKGVIDVGNVVYYVSVIAFGLFLTLRAVDAERWRG